MLLKTDKMTVEMRDDFNEESGKQSIPNFESPSYITSSNDSPVEGLNHKDSNDSNVNEEKLNSKKEIEEFETKIVDDFNLPRRFDNADPEQRAILNRALSNFNYIEESILVGTASYEPKEEFMPCTCKIVKDKDGNKKCCDEGSDCINRILLLECKKGICTGGKYCKNQRFQRKENAPIRVIETLKKGFGLEAVKDLYKGQFVMEYVGEVVSHESFLRRAERYHERGNKHFYFMSLKSDKIIDATTTGSLSRFINHSCNPNCILQKWMVGSRIRIGIFTTRAISAGEELTFDYQFERYGAEAQPCYCEEPNCKGFIGASKSTEFDNIPGVSGEGGKVGKIFGFRNDEEVHKLISLMLKLHKDADLASALLQKLLLTEEERYFKLFLRFHGLVPLKNFLIEYSNEEKVYSELIEILDRLPFKSKNRIVKLDLINILKDSLNDKASEIQLKINGLISKWEPLPENYVIPKISSLRNNNDTDSQREENGSPNSIRLDLTKPNTPQHSPSLKASNYLGSKSTPIQSNSRVSDDSEKPYCSHFYSRNWDSNAYKPSQLRKSSFPLKSRLQCQRTNEACDDNEKNDLTNLNEKISAPVLSTSAIKSLMNITISNQQGSTIHQYHKLNETQLNSQYDNTRFNKDGSDVAIHHTFSNTGSFSSQPIQQNINQNLTSSKLMNQGGIESFKPQNFGFITPYQNFGFVQSSFPPPFMPPYPSHISNHVPSLGTVLPPNWYRATAPSGQEYYYNTLTNETTWTMPQWQSSTEFKPPPPPPNNICDIQTQIGSLPKIQNSSLISESLSSSYEHHESSKKEKEAENNTSTKQIAPLSNSKNRFFDKSDKQEPAKKPKSTEDDTGLYYEGIYTQEELKSKLKRLIATEVVKYFNPYYKKISKSDFKKYAEKMTLVLIEKEMRLDCYKEGKIKIFDSKKKQAIKAFVLDYADKLLLKMKQYEQLKVKN